MKRNTFKRTLSCLLALCLLLTAAPLGWLSEVDWHLPDFSKLFSVSSHAATIVDSGDCGDQGNNVKWTLDSNGLLTISGTGNMNGYGSVYSNYNQAPWGGSTERGNRVKKIVINKGVTSIGNYAFYDCSSLTGVTIPDSVTSIGSDAFSGCSNLTSVTIPDSVTCIQDFAFAGCSSLTRVTIPDSVTSIWEFAFAGCSSVTRMEVSAGNPVFHSAGNCIIDTESKTLILGCKASVIPSDGSVTSIGGLAFSGCSGLTRVTIPDSVTSIAYSAFDQCSSLTSVTIPDRVTSIGAYVFSGCSSLTRMEVATGNPVYHSSGNCIIETESKTLIAGCKTSVIPSDGSVTSIGRDAFSDCSSLTSVTIGNGVTSIEGGAFSGCSSLTSVTIPDSVTSIGESAFGYCSSLTDVYYTGTESEWEKIKIDSWRNDCLLNATIHYNSSDPGAGGIAALPEGISALYPANGEAAYDFVNESYLKITFNEAVLRNDASPLSKDYSAKLNFAAGTIKVYNAENNKIYWQATEWDLTKLGSKDKITVSTTDPKTLLINVGISLDPLTDYYVTLDPGFVSLNSDQPSPGIEKGQWQFKTQWVSGITFKDSWFNQTSEKYQHGIAQLCSQFVTIGYYKKDQVKNALELAGFSVRNEDIQLSTGRDQVNYFIAKKEVPTNDGTKTLVFCGFIGSHKLQWNSNFDPYGTKRSEDSKAENLADPNKKGIVHLGFEDAKTFVMNKLDQYMKDNGISASQAKFLVTGHSRGAATANLVAADLIRGAFGLNPDDVYAYTFATPNNVKKKEIKDFNDKKFNRIYNIVNPQDFVTCVLPTAWEFSKYGTTYLLPTRDNVGLKRYNKYKANMLKYFAKVQPGTTFEDYDKGEVTTYNVVKKFTDNVKSLDEFYRKDIYTFSNETITYKKPFEYFQEVLCPFVNDTDSKVIAGIKAVGILSSDAAQSGLYSRLTGYFIANGTDLHQNFGHAHMAETYCSYMMTLSSEVIQEPKSSEYYKSHCPVDIEIYDKETGELLGRTVNNVVDETVAAGENAVVIEVEGDEKSFMLPDSINYEIKYIPYGEGKMDLTVASIGDDLTETARVNFYEVPLTPGVVYDSVSESDAALSDYVLTAGGDKEIKPDQVLTSEEAKQFTVTVRNANGEDSTETTLYVTEGDYATVTPILPEGMLFAGWYNGEVLVSTEEAYRFRPTGDITLTAKFNPAALPGDVSGDGKVTAEDARLALRAAVGLETYEAGSPEFLAADANHDGEIKAEDARLILRAAVGLETLT